MKNFVILIPPFEGKISGGNAPNLKMISNETREMVNRLQSFKGDSFQLLGVKGKALAQALQSNRSILSSPTMPAIERYSVKGFLCV